MIFYKIILFIYYTIGMAKTMKKSVCIGKGKRACGRTRRFCKYASGTKRKFCRKRRNTKKV